MALKLPHQKAAKKSLSLPMVIYLVLDMMLWGGGLDYLYETATIS